MKKKRAILNFAGIIFVCLLLAVLSVVRFTIPGTYYKEYVGFLRAIELGIDYKGGTTLVIEAKNNSADYTNFAKGVEAHALRIKGILADNNYNSNVYTTLGTSLVMEIFDEYDTDAISDLISATNNKLAIRTENSTTGEVYLTQDDIEDAYAMENGYYGYTNTSRYGVYVKFTQHGKEQIKTITSGASSSSKKTLYFFIGDSLFQQLPVSEEVDQDYIFISGGSTLNTKDGADQYAGKLLSTKYDYTFEQKSKTVIQADVAQRNLILSLVITAVIIIASMIMLIVRFKKLGLVNCLALIVGVLLQIIMLQAVPGIVITVQAFMGSVLTYVLGFGMIYYMLSKMAGEYAQGKKAHSSFKFGFLKNYMPLVELSVSYLVANIIFYIFGSTAVKYFAFASIIGIVIYGLCAILVSKLFNKLCLNIYQEKVKNYGFTREANVHELEEI